MRALLTSARRAGLREHQGQIVGKAVWEPIVTEQMRARVLARLSEQSRTGRRSPRRYLLSGMLRCGKCQGVLFSAARQDTRRYVCSAGPDHGGCGRLTVVAAPVEDLIARAVLLRLDSPELADALSGRAAADEHTAALALALAEDRRQQEKLGGLWAAKKIDTAGSLCARGDLEARIRDAETRPARLTRSDALSGLVGHGQQLRAQWAELDLTRQAAIVRAVLDHAVIGPGVSWVLAAWTRDGSGRCGGCDPGPVRSGQVLRGVTGAVLPTTAGRVPGPAVPVRSTRTRWSTRASVTCTGRPCSASAHERATQACICSSVSRPPITATRRSDAAAPARAALSSPT